MNIKQIFFNCLLEISRTNNINGHKHAYACLESLEKDENYNISAVVRIYLK